MFWDEVILEPDLVTEIFGAKLLRWDGAGIHTVRNGQG